MEGGRVGANNRNPRATCHMNCYQKVAKISGELMRNEKIGDLIRQEMDIWIKLLHLEVSSVNATPAVISNCVQVLLKGTFRSYLECAHLFMCEQSFGLGTHFLGSATDGKEGERSWEPHDNVMMTC